MDAIENFWHDVRFAIRLATKNRNLTLAVVFSLALGIGGTCAFFSVIYGILVDPYVYQDASRIIVPTFSEPDSDGRRPPLYYTMADFLEMDKSLAVFESAIYATSRTAVTSGALPRNANVMDTSPNFFQFFGTPAFLGRTFAKGDVPRLQTPPPIAVIGYQFWTKEFEGRPDAIGRDLRLGEKVYQVIGVMPPRFTWFDTDVFTPEAFRPDTREYGSVYLRLRKGAALRSADAELQALTERAIRQNAAAYPNAPIRMHAVPLQQWLNGKSSGKWIILMIAVSMLLLIACGNVSVLLLARSDARQQEIAMRFALGANTARILRQLLTETLVFSAAGCALGLILAWRGVPAILAALPETSLPHEAVVGVNVPVLAFALGVSLATGLLVGVSPAFRLTRATIRSTVQAGGRATNARISGLSIQTILVVAEIALSAMLLLCSGVALRNYLALSHANLGYNPQKVAVLSMSAPHRRNLTWAERLVDCERIERTVKAIPGVRSVSEARAAVPPAMEFESTFSVVGNSDIGFNKAAVGEVGTEYFQTLQTPLYAGRSFTDAEMQQGAQVAVVNRTFANRLIKNGITPVGAQIRVVNLPTSQLASPPRQSHFFRIVGVVATIENQNLARSSAPAIYLPYSQYLNSQVTMLVRTDGNPLQLERIFQKRLHSLVDAEAPVADFDTLEHILRLSSMADAQSSATLFSIFAVVALGLGAFGIYSVASLTIAQRRKEFAIRRALGAQSSQIVAPLLKWVVSVVTSGMLLGILGTFVFGNVLAYYEQGWRPSDVLTLTSACVVLLVVDLIAILPALCNAALILPQQALRLQ